MKKARKKLILYSMLSVFVLLTALLSVINIVNFSMAASDADALTQAIAERGGAFMGENTISAPRRGGMYGMGRMSPDSPEAPSSIRYFTYELSKDGDLKKIAFNMSAMSENEAENLAQSLIGGTTGWTKGFYRYRVYELRGGTFITVIDQGREIWPCYRILIISACGEAIGLIISCLILIKLGRKLFRPLEAADRKQSKFIAGMEREFSVPLTVISANTELIETGGEYADETGAIRRQIKQMSELLKRLSDFSVFSEESRVSRVNLSDMLSEQTDEKRSAFEEKQIALETEIEPNVTIDADAEMVKRLIAEIIENALKFAKSKARISLTKQDERVLMLSVNDSELPDGSCDQVFDRFVRLENAKGVDGAGLGLTAVKDIAALLSGRVNAEVKGGEFVLRVAL